MLYFPLICQHKGNIIITYFLANLSKGRDAKLQGLNRYGWQPVAIFSNSAFHEWGCFFIVPIMVQPQEYNRNYQGLDCKSEGHILSKKKGSDPDVHFCNKEVLAYEKTIYCAEILLLGVFAAFGQSLSNL